MSHESPAPTAREVSMRNLRRRRTSSKQTPLSQESPDQHSATVSISDVHTRIFWVMDHLQEILPEEASKNQMGQMLIVFMREAKKDIKRLPEDFVQSLSRVIGEAFTWVADGDVSEPPVLENEIDELLANV
jgi:hypothetical protein